MILWTILSLITCLLLLPAASKIAYELNFVDHPDERKRHDEAVAPVGGLVIIPVFLIISVISGLSVAENFSFIAALTMLWLLGALDDKYHLPAKLKIFVQFLAAIILVYGNNNVVYYLGDLFGFGEVWIEPFVAEVFTVFCVVFVINAINMIDGLDGLCGGVCFIILSALTCAAVISGGHELIQPLLILIGAVSAFLYFNYRHPGRERAALFLGDSGSTSMGLIISWLVIELTQSTSTQAGLLNPGLIALILSLPVFDALALFAYRLNQARSPFSADRRHLHYLICDRGASIETSVNIIHALTLAYSLSGVILITVFSVPLAYIMPVWVAAFCLHFAVIFGALKKTLTKIIESY